MNTFDYRCNKSTWFCYVWQCIKPIKQILSMSSMAAVNLVQKENYEQLSNRIQGKSQSNNKIGSSQFSCVRAIADIPKRG